MGLIKPPWISEKWFKQTPFNYCDHFGDKAALAQVCKICLDEIEWQEQCLNEGKDPYDMKVVFKKVIETFATVHAMLQKDLERMGIDVENIPDSPESPAPETHRIYNVVASYGNQIEKAIQNLQHIPLEADEKLVETALSALAHSRHYAQVKIARAVDSRIEDRGDPEDELHDAKTSALFAFIAVERNSRALLALAGHKPLRELRKNHLRLAKQSIIVSQLIQEEFFPDQELEFEEYGGLNF